LLLEADRGFADLQGRREPFHAFLARELRERRFMKIISLAPEVL